MNSSSPDPESAAFMSNDFIEFYNEVTGKNFDSKATTPLSADGVTVIYLYAVNPTNNDDQLYKITISNEPEILGIMVNESAGYVTVRLSRPLIENETLIAASYNGVSGGDLLNLKTCTAAAFIPEGGYSYNVELPTSEGAKSVKIMWWGRMNRIRSLCAAQSVSKNVTWSEFLQKTD